MVIRGKTRRVAKHRNMEGRIKERGGKNEKKNRKEEKIS